MNRSKRLLSLLLAVMLILTTVVSTTIISASADTIDNAALVSDYYATNPNGQIGKQGSITIDGSFSDWTQDMLIAKGAAWDVANHYKGGHENCVLDTIGLYAAWDSSNLYVAWQMVNTTDTWQREGDASLSDGGRVLDVPLILALSVDPSSPSMTNKVAGGKNIWDMKAGVEFTSHVDHLFYMSGKPGLGKPSMFTAIDAEGNTDYTTGCKEFSTIGVSYKMAEGNVSDTIWGLNYSQDPSDVTNPDADWVDYKTFTGDMGAHKTSYDSFYEIQIPLSVLGIDANYLTTNGIGAMVVATRGESGLDCIPFDTTMLDNALDEYGSDPSTSHEKDDVDNITVPLAKIGKGGAFTPSVTQPTTATPSVTQPTTAEPVVTQPTTAEPVVTQPTTAEPVVTEPSEVTTTAPIDIEKPTDPIVIPPAPTTAPTEPSEVITVPVPTLDFGDDTTPTETTPSTSIVVVEKGILGDADGNNAINIKDATAIQKHLAKLTTLSEEAQFLADVDANEVLNIRDATNIQKWIAKMPVDYAIGEPVVDEEIIVPVPTSPIMVPTTVATVPTTVTAPIVVEPTTEATEPSTAEPVVTEPTTVEPVVTEPVVTDPIETEPVVTDPIETEPPVTEPPVTEPIVTDPPYTEPPYSEPVTDPYYPPVGGKTVYFSNNKFWSTVNAYTWPTGGEGSWPGSAMTLVGQNEHGEDIYSFVVPEGHDNIIFNDGNAQTVDINLNELTQNGFYTTGEDQGKFTVANYEYTG